MQKWLYIAIVSALLGGCAGRRGADVQPKSPSPAATTRAADSKANLTLEHIEPRVILPPAATQPANDRAPLKAVELYAKARGAMLENRRFGAMKLLEEAVTLDPHSVELRLALADAQLGSATFNDESIASLEKAAAIQPDNLDVQVKLGRQYYVKNDLPKALVALRRAKLTREYAEGGVRAAVADMFLAEALQLAGYDRAALSSYASLLDRIEDGGPEMRGNPDIYYYAQHPETLWIKIGALHERSGRHAEALAAYEVAAKRDPDNFDLQVRLVRMLIELRRPEARERAKQVVKSFDARGDAVTLLRDAHRSAGNEAGAVDVLRQLLKEDPKDRLVFYALVDLLQQSNRHREARQLLVATLRSGRYEVELIDRLVRLHEVDADYAGAARLLIEASAARPELVSRLHLQWLRLIQHGSRSRIRLADVQKLSVPKEQEGARQFWISRIAGLTNRAPLAKSAMDKALAAEPVFTPAYRVALVEALALDPANPDAPGVKDLLNRAAARPAVAAELQGFILIAKKQPVQAESAFRRAMELGARSAELQDALVDAVLAQNKDAAAEKLLWEITREWPAYEPAFRRLIGFFAARGNENQVVKTIDTWLSADTSSVTARLFQAQFLIQQGRPDVAESVLQLLLSEKPDSAEVLAQVQAMYDDLKKLDVLAVKLVELNAKQPGNREVIERLLDVQLQLKRRREANATADAARKVFVNDADGLYFVSGLYQRLEQKEEIESVLQQALKVDPKHPGAANDLGYNWVDSGRNLDQAEELVRIAVAGEPDNQAYLDSLGWVLYKRSRFDEAVHYLQRASEGPRPDPIVLDHLGDAMYRVKKNADAESTWKRAAERLEQTGTHREDLRKLKLELVNKLKQAKDGNPVTVAPIIDAPPAKAGAESRGPSYGKTQEKKNGRP